MLYKREKITVFLLTLAMKWFPLKEIIRSIIWDVGYWVNFQIHEITAYCVKIKRVSNNGSAELIEKIAIF
jgi:hypothetical protein